MTPADNFPVNLEGWEAIDLARTFSPWEIAIMRKGFVPQYMEHRWLISMEGHLLVFRRSWTGYPIYAIEILGEDGHQKVVNSSWVSRNRDHYNPSSLNDEVNLLARIIDSHLLNDRFRYCSN